MTPANVCLPSVLNTGPQTARATPGLLLAVFSGAGGSRKSTVGGGYRVMLLISEWEKIKTEERI